MRSPPAEIFFASLSKARLLAKLSVDPRLKPLSPDHKYICLHAALALYVASWESYVENIVERFYLEVNDPLDVRYSNTLYYLQLEMKIEKAKFNTPNANNSRNFIVSYTGFDPIGHWIWPERQLSGISVRNRLDEILKIRHSFAHGFSMPSFGWNVASNGTARLTVGILTDVERFFLNLVRRTDSGLLGHISSVYGRVPNW